MLRLLGPLFFLFISCGSIQASILDYFLPRRATNDSPTETDIEALPSVPYELSERDERFLAEAAKIANLNLSELDLCHHRVILKLKKSCNELNADQLGKLSVMLLNCQSVHEGRQMFPCTDTMTLKECTSEMSPEAWNAYHIVTNRVKAVCSTVRHEQFRGLTEMTVNKLMSTAHEQINLLNHLSEDHKQLREMTVAVIEDLNTNSEKLINQQNDLLELSNTQRESVDENLKELMKEKALIKSGQMEVAHLLSDLRNRIDETLKNLDSQSVRSKLQFDAILDDLQNESETLINKIETTSGFTLEQLNKMNQTIYKVANLVADLQDKFMSLSNTAGGSDVLLKRLSVTITHLAFILLGMLCLVFINIDQISRVIFITIAPGNFIAELLEYPALDLITVACTITSLIIVNYLIKLLCTDKFKGLFMMKGDINGAQSNGQKSVIKASSPSGEPNTVGTVYQRNAYSSQRIYENISGRESSVTAQSPNVSRFSSRFDDDNMSTKSGTPFSTSNNRFQCLASTQKGGPCRNAAVNGEDYCRVHLRQRAN